MRHDRRTAILEAMTDATAKVAPGELVLVTGASGYVGGRLVSELLERGYRVRCLVRTPDKVLGAPWRSHVEVVEGDLDGDLSDAFDGVAAAYYLVHAIGATSNWIAQDRDRAARFTHAAQLAGTRRIVYLGGLGHPAGGRPLSAHLASRHEVGRALAAGSVPVTELRAAVVIGSGSASFEMLRYLVEVLPAMVTPKWVDTNCQPIAIRDVLRYLVEAVGTPETAGRILEIGGPDVLSYRSMMAIYAEEAGLARRLIVSVPVLTPRLSSLWVGLVTPLPRSLARPLVDSLVNEVIVRDPAITTLLPGPLLSYRDAVRLAIGRVRSLDVATTWAGAELPRGPEATAPTDPSWSGGTVLVDRRRHRVAATPKQTFATLCRIGGNHGWYRSEFLWTLRGLVDKLAGGPGMRRGRRHPDNLRVGDALDFWRVQRIEVDHRLRLRAEMRLPGEAWLEWTIEPSDDGTESVVEQVAEFRPRGLLGRAYWYAVSPFHRVVFPGMLAGLAAEAAAESDPPAAPLNSASV